MSHAAHTQDAKTVLQIWDTSDRGLSTEEAQARLEHYGRNTLPEARPPGLWLIFLRQFKDPLIYILLFAGIASLLMGKYPSAVFIFVVLMINAIIGTIQEYSATHAAAALKAMASPAATVWRDGQRQELDAAGLVPGDIIQLESGNKVPADVRLVTARQLKVDESLLTGESEPATKQAAITLEDNTPVSDRENMAFAGSMITSGRATAVVVATGLNTQMGTIAKYISADSATKSPLIIRMERFTIKIALAIGLIVLAISAVMYWRGDPPQEIFLMAIGLSVSAIPAGLPVALTVALAIGMRRMARRHVIVRRLMAVEALGSATMIASDKTGTLTRNEMTAEQLVLPDGQTLAINTGTSPADGTFHWHEEPTT
jgi:magnesium-transporting ATPase (P-type)